MVCKFYLPCTNTLMEAFFDSVELEIEHWIMVLLYSSDMLVNRNKEKLAENIWTSNIGCTVVLVSFIFHLNLALTTGILG